MITAIQDKQELLSEIHGAVSELLHLTGPLEEKSINTVPYEGSWTPGQLLRHVAKSVNGMGRAMGMDGKPPERDPGARIEELKKVFLDFTHKMKSPDFIVPEEQWYEKQAISEELRSAEDQLKENANKANLTELVTGLPLGPVTKLEILHFALFHTQRHVHQMKKMEEALRVK